MFICWPVNEMKWNESGFRPPLCTYRLNSARRTSWGWWDDRDDTVLQTQDSKFEPWRSKAEHATSRSRRLPTILTFTRGWGRNTFCFFQTAETGNRTPNSGVKGSGANHYPRAPARCWPVTLSIVVHNWMGDRLRLPGVVYTRTYVQRCRVVGLRVPRKSDGSSDWLRVGRKRTSMELGAVSIWRNPRKSTMWCDSTRGAIAPWAVSLPN